jgi:hypothetical protein
MKQKKNLTLRYFGITFFLIGMGLNINMYLERAWPTYLFFIISMIGIIEIILSFVLKKIKTAWQIVWALIPFIIGYMYLKFI